MLQLPNCTVYDSSCCLHKGSDCETYVAFFILTPYLYVGGGVFDIIYPWTETSHFTRFITFRSLFNKLAKSVWNPFEASHSDDFHDRTIHATSFLKMNRTFFPLCSNPYLRSSDKLLLFSHRAMTILKYGRRPIVRSTLLSMIVYHFELKLTYLQQQSSWCQVFRLHIQSLSKHNLSKETVSLLHVVWRRNVLISDFEPV